MRFLIVTLLHVICLICHSQTNSVDFIFDSNNNDIARDILEDENGKYYVVGYTGSSGTSLNNVKGLILKINSEGNLIDSVTISIPDREYYLMDIIYRTSNDILIAGFSTSYDSNLNSSIVLTQIDTNLIIQNSCTWPLGPESGLSTMNTSIGDNQEILITGAVRPDEYANQLFIYRFSQSMDSLRYMMYVNDPYSGSEIRQISENEYWVLEGLAGEYFIFDSLFNKVSQTHVPYNVTAPYGLKWDTDTSFYLAGQGSFEQNHDISLIHQIDYKDTLGLIFNWWGTQDTLDITASWGALDYKNKDSIFIGGATNFWPYYWAEIPTWYFVIQTDSLLNIRWERFIGGDAHLMVEKLIATNDGGCLLAASRYDYMHSTEPQTDIQIIKLNENGQLVNQDENILVKSTEAIIYPNPGIHSLNIRLARQYKEFSFELYSISGKLVLSETYKSIQENINAINLKAGTYIYRIYNKKGLFESGKWIKKE